MIAAWTVLLYASGVTALQSALRNVRQSTSLAVEGEIISISAPVRSHEQLVELGLNLDEYPDDNYRHILGVNDLVHAPSKLQKICQIRMKDVAHSKLPLDVHGCGIDRSFYISEDDMVQDIHDFDEVYGKPFNLMDRIASVYPSMAIAAEFKRASPSKGDINPNVDVVQQTLQYADVGSAVISVLTEFKHFKGTLEDMKKVRLATQAKYKDKRPAILRKDFILDRYQLYEARAHGADTVLLIVAVLGVNQLKDLIARARGLGMEPLVEVHTQQEMTIALDCGAKVIGVNNRNLHTFQLDLETTAKAISVAQARGVSWRPQGHGLPDIFIAALSGITSSDDVSLFRDLGVSCCLIGNLQTVLPSSECCM
jgi:indole-3-glycerol phosphate synthase